MGRETFIAKTIWENEWPVIAPGIGHLEDTVDIPVSYTHLDVYKRQEQIGAECEETWLVGQDKDDAINSLIATGEYPDFVLGETALYLSLIHI